MMHRELTDEQWQRLQPLLPKRKSKRGRPRTDDRLIIDAIRWMLRTGAPWRDLPSKYGPWQTVYSRLRRWKQAGAFDRLLADLQRQADAKGRLDWEVHHVDGTVIRAHQHAAGGKGDPSSQALGWSRGGFSTKVHLRGDQAGHLLVVLLTAGQRHESVVFESLMEQGAVKRPGRGRPKRRPKRIVGDKGYSHPRIRRYLRRRGIRVTIARPKDQPRGGPFDRAIYRGRNVIERLINRLKHFRRLATRYDKLAETYRTMWVIGASFLFLFANTT